MALSLRDYISGLVSHYGKEDELPKFKKKGQFSNYGSDNPLQDAGTSMPTNGMYGASITPTEYGMQSDLTNSVTPSIPYGGSATGVAQSFVSPVIGQGSPSVPIAPETKEYDPYESMARLKMAQSVGDSFQVDTPTPTPNAIEQPSIQQQIATPRGEGTTISPILGKQSLTELERMKMAQALRGY